MNEPKIIDGGPAFPTLDNTEHWRHLGVSIRDYFAAAALQGMLSNIDDAAGSETFAEAAYEFADAMLERRKR